MDELAQPDTVEIKKKIKYLKDFVDSDGWHILTNDIQNQIYEHTVAFSSKTVMPSQEIDYRRGALLVLNSFLTYPDRLIENLQNQLPIDEVK